MNEWQLVTMYHSIKRYCLFVGTNDGYKVVKVFSNKVYAKVYAKVYHINFTEGKV